MHEIASRERLQPSLLDRLTDAAPEQTRETFEQQTLGMQQLRQAVLRDLAWLLNTTSPAATEDLSAAPLAAKSTINFGVRGFAGLVGTSDRIASLCAGIAEAIRRSEPRIRAETSEGADAPAARGQADTSASCSRSRASSGRSRCRSSSSWRPRSSWRRGLSDCHRRKETRLMDPRCSSTTKPSCRMCASSAPSSRASSRRLPRGSDWTASRSPTRMSSGCSRASRFLAARVQLKLDAEFPRFTQRCSQIVYPHYLAPTPSMVVVQLTPDASANAAAARRRTAARHRAAQPARHRATRPPASSAPRTTSALADRARARPSYIALRRPPLGRAAPARAPAEGGVRARLRATGGLTFAQLALDALPLFLAGGRTSVAHGCTSSWSAKLRRGLSCARRSEPLPSQDRCRPPRVRPLGFDDEEALLPLTPALVPGLPAAAGVLRVPAALPVRRARRAGRAVSRCAGNELEIVLLLDRERRRARGLVRRPTLALFCTPAINLFPKRADRIHLTRQRRRVPRRARPHAPAGLRGLSA